MPVTNYHSVNGVIIAEHTTGQSRLDYVTDALGSVIATVDQTLTVQSTARYKPYGAVLSETGTQPLNGWVGSLGYRRTGLPYSDVYIRARIASTVEGRWTTVDPLWPSESPYSYVGCSPTTGTDPTGYGSVPPCSGNIKAGILKTLCKNMAAYFARVSCSRCGGYCSCFANVTVSGSASAVFTVTDWDTSPIKTKTPCSLSGTFKCNTSASASQPCPSGSSCILQLEPCKLNVNDNRNPPDQSGIYDITNPLTGTVYHVKWKLSSIHLSMQIVGTVGRLGCKKREDPC